MVMICSRSRCCKRLRCDASNKVGVKRYVFIYKDATEFQTLYDNIKHRFNGSIAGYKLVMIFPAAQTVIGNIRNCFR